MGTISQIAKTLARKVAPRPTGTAPGQDWPTGDMNDFNAFAANASPYRDALYTDFSAHKQDVFRAVYPFLLAGAEAAVSLMRAVEHVVAHRIDGDFVECGVYQGGNPEIMIRTLQRLGAERTIYLYDTFEGMPKPTAPDDEKLVGDGWRIHFDPAKGDSGSKWLDVDENAVRARLLALGYPASLLHFVKGMVEDTIPRTVPDKIAILRLDTDYYPSTKHELVQLYPRLVSGGILIIDDYGAFPGCKRAVDEFQQEHGTRLFLNRVDRQVRLAVKP